MFDLADPKRAHIHEFIAAVYENQHKGESPDKGRLIRRRSTNAISLLTMTH